MKTIFYFPQKKIKELFSNKKDYFFFDYKGLYKIKNSKRVDIHLPKKIDYSLLKNKNFESLINEISRWGPVWSRFVDRGDQYELYKREILIKSFKIINFLKKNNIKLVIMCTFISHNLQSLMFDLICKHSSIKQIFFYHCSGLPGNKDNFLIPLVQNQKFINRKIIKLRLSNYSFRNFLIKKRDDLKNLSEDKISNFKSYYEEYFYSRSAYLSILKSIIYYSYANLRRSFLKILNPNFYFIDIMNYSVGTHVKQILQQKRSIAYYLKNSKNLYDLPKKKYLLIAAHNQPEASSYPVGQEWNNHIDIMLEIRKKNYKIPILYKEHRTNFNYYDAIIHHGRKGTNRSKQYYKNLIDLDTVFLKENHNMFSSETLKNILPVTISGTIAIERSLLGYKTIYFGYPIWSGLPGTIHISRIKDLSNFKKYLNHDKEISKKAINFLCKMLDNKSIDNSVEMHAVPWKGKSNHAQFVKSIKKIIKNYNFL